MRLLDDNPTTEDKLGYRPTADLLFEVVTGAAARPLTVGVFGGWGSGKTSVMRMVEEKLKAQGIKSVWFNAWKYDGKEVIWNALIQTVLLKMRDDAGAAKSGDIEAFKKNVIRVSKELAKYAAKVGTRFVPGGILREEDVDAFLRAIAPSADDDLFAFVNRFEDVFDRLVKEYVGEDGYLVVFVDDLDRCLPENAIEVMEALKLYLDRANCVFVVGVEPAIIEEAIRRRYADNQFLPASEYLEKIVQIPFVLPRMRAETALGLAEGMAVDSFPERSTQLSRIVRYGLSRNPRRIKRFINAFVVASYTAGNLTQPERLILAKILVLQTRFPDFYRRLMQDPGLIAKLQEADEATWHEKDMAELYENIALRQFLKKTRSVGADEDEVRQWIRVAKVTRDSLTDGDDYDLEDVAEEADEREFERTETR